MSRVGDTDLKGTWIQLPASLWSQLGQEPSESQGWQALIY